jgi:hypothetical protein
VDICKLHDDLESARAIVPPDVDIIHKLRGWCKFIRFWLNNLASLFNPCGPSFHELILILVLFLVRSFVLLIRVLRVRVIDNVIIGDAQRFVLAFLQWGECRVPERDAACNYFFDDDVEISVFVGMEVVDITCDPEEVAFETSCIKKENSRSIAYLTLSSPPEISTSQGSHWKLLLNGFFVGRW